MAVTVSPTLFFTELISAVVEALMVAPVDRLRLGAGAADGAAADGLEEALLGDAAGRRLGRVGVFAPGAGALAVGRSLSGTVVSTGASCRSRLRLSAAAVSPPFPRPQAATAANVSAAIIVLDI
ncbi:MAG TPA: hypothetical protein VK535_05300 [Gemmatimonadales bacterium]|nr:hypothetical protein [Gemmatimonadales bacterium]